MRQSLPVNIVKTEILLFLGLTNFPRNKKCINVLIIFIAISISAHLILFSPFHLIIGIPSFNSRGEEIFFKKKKKKKKKRGDKKSFFFSSEPASNRFNIIVDDNKRLRKRRKTIHVLAERRNSTRVERENVSKYLV